MQEIDGNETIQYEFIESDIIIQDDEFLQQLLGEAQLSTDVTSAEQPIVDDSPSTSNDLVTESNNSGNQEIRKETQLSRKRQCNRQNWKSSVRKTLRQSGQEYVDKKNKKHAARIFIYKNCLKCPFKCSKQINEEEAEAIHNEFWRLSDDEKLHFYDKTTQRLVKKRVRKENRESVRPRAHSFVFQFKINDQVRRVCREFYLSILGISARRIGYFHARKKDGITKTPQRDQRGRKTKIKIPEVSRELVKEHINSFPRVPGHYCRANTKKEYLEFGLNLTKLYELYEEFCANRNVEPVKKWLYSKIFNSEFNIDFYTPKKDQCDLCCEFNNQQKCHNLSEELEQKYRTHINEKEQARNEKHQDKENESEEKSVICFDLQRVLNVPQTNVSKAYYLPKLNTFNLTGCDVKHKQGYCILWHEGLSGRSGNDIASAVIQLLLQFVTKNSSVREIILWSDACVPQNRNSHMTTALLEFINDNSNNIVKIEQKFQEPGHSCVQEVDAIHSTIDKSFSRADIQSPLDMVGKFIKIRAKQPYIVYQMKHQDFKNFQEVANSTNLKDIPYSKIKHIIYEGGSNVIQYRITFSTGEYQKITVSAKKHLRNNKNTFIPQQILPFLPKPVSIRKILSQDKIDAVKSLFPQFSLIHVEFWNALFNENKTKSSTVAVQPKKTKKMKKMGK